MGRYDDVVQFLSRCEAQQREGQKMTARCRHTPDEVGRLRDRYPGIPEDYLDYLAEVGDGGNEYAVYNGLVGPEDIFGSRADAFGKRLLCFGDNFMGDVGAFLPDEGWAVVELVHEDMSICPTEQSFAQFIRSVMDIGASGEDPCDDGGEEPPPPPSAGPVGHGRTTEARPKPWWKLW